MKKIIVFVIAVAAAIFFANTLTHASTPLPLETDEIYGNIHVVGNEEMEFPLKHTSVTANVDGFVADVEVMQEYVNPYEQAIEAVYVFPLPNNAAVYDMEMKIGDRTIKAEIKEREEAKQIYDQAKQQGKRAGLLEQERPNIFTQSVANIMPGDDITVIIKYVENLEFELDTYEFVFPMVVGPRYIPGDRVNELYDEFDPNSSAFKPAIDDADRITPPNVPPGMRSGHDIDVTVNLDGGDLSITNIASVTHDIVLNNQDDNKTSITLEPYDTIPNKDLVIEYQLSNVVPEISLFPHRVDGEDGYFAMVVQPQTRFTEQSVAPKEIFFIVDTSGSMQGEPIAKVKAAMRYALKNLNPQDSFWLAQFSMSVNELDQEILPATPENIKRGLEFIENIRAAGGTEMMSAMNAALDYPKDPNALRIISLMSDGYVGNESQILGTIQDKLDDNTRLFPFGIGSSVNRYLLDSMGRLGRGETYYATLRDSSEDTVEEFYNRIKSPLLTDISINWGGLDVYDVYPERIPDLFGSEPVYVYGRYTGGGTPQITVKGKSGQVIPGFLGNETREDYSIVYNAVLPSISTDNDWVGRLWARKKITVLSDELFNGEEQSIVDEITALGLRHRLVTKYTSFVAVDSEVVADPNKDPMKIDVPILFPEGTNPSAFGAYAPSSGSLAFPQEFAGFSTTDIKTTIENIVRLVAMAIGFLGLVLLTIWFIIWMRARKVPDGSKKGKVLLIISIVVILLAVLGYVGASFVISSLQGAV